MVLDTLTVFPFSCWDTTPREEKGGREHIRQRTRREGKGAGERRKREERGTHGESETCRIDVKEKRREGSGQAQT